MARRDRDGTDASAIEVATNASGACQRPNMRFRVLPRPWGCSTRTSAAVLCRASPSRGGAGGEIPSLRDRCAFQDSRYRGSRPSLPNLFRHYVNLLIMGHVLLILFNELFTIFERSWSARHNWLREGEHAENLSAHKPGAF